jgi:hypothetical protein
MGGPKCRTYQRPHANHVSRSGSFTIYGYLCHGRKLGIDICRLNGVDPILYLFLTGFTGLK